MVSDINQLSSSVSILLGVLTYFLSLVNDKTTRLLKEDVPPTAAAIARIDMRSRCYKALLAGHLPMIAGFFVLFYLCLPTSISILGISSFDLWCFDPLRTLLVFLEIGVLMCLLFSISLTMKVRKRLRALRD